MLNIVFFFVPDGMTSIPFFKDLLKWAYGGVSVGRVLTNQLSRNIIDTACSAIYDEIENAVKCPPLHLTSLHKNVLTFEFPTRIS